MQPTIRPGTRVDDQVDPGYEPMYHLILLDDDHHTYQYVILMLGKIFGYSKEKAFAIACIVDAHGQAILMTGPKDEVQKKQDQVHAFGADPLMEASKGSMSAIIEPA